ncbi:unnamed protein product, partial [Heterotrigona itama]
MHKDKEENSHHDSHYRARELAAFAAYDHHHLDGEMFLQPSQRPFETISLNVHSSRAIKQIIPTAGYAIETTTKRDCFKETLKPPVAKGLASKQQFLAGDCVPS